MAVQLDRRRPDSDQAETQAPGRDDAENPPEQRLVILEQLRRLGMYMQTAQVLDCRARASANPALAAVLRERADVRRHRAELVRAELAERGVPLILPRPHDPAVG
jgi:hypothetical protein